MFLMQDHDTQSVHSLSGFNTAQLIPPDQAQRGAGNANRAGELYLVIELVRPDIKHLRASTVPGGVDTGASLNSGGQAAQRPRRRICVPRSPISEHN